MREREVANPASIAPPQQLTAPIIPPWRALASAARHYWKDFPAAEQMALAVLKQAPNAEAHLLIFDRAPTVPRDKKIDHQTHQQDALFISVWGM